MYLFANICHMLPYQIISHINFARSGSQQPMLATYCWCNFHLLDQ